MKRIDELEKEREKDKSLLKNFEKMSQEKSLSTDVSSFNENSVAIEFFNNSQNSFELEDWKKDIEKNIEKINEKIKLENNENIITSIDSKLDRNNLELENIKSFIDEFQKKCIDLDRKFEKFTKFEKLISELINQINNLRKNNTSWQADFLKNMNEFNQKIMNQEILLDQLDIFEKNTNKKIDTICSELKKIPTELSKHKIEVIFLYFNFLILTDQ